MPSHPAEVLVGERPVGPGRPCLVVAEGGINHNGDPGIAHRLVDLAADAGADAIKFQIFEPAALAAANAEAAPYQRQLTETLSQLPLLESLVLPATAWAEIMAHAGERGLLFLCTAFDRPSADVIDLLGVPAFKIPSGELDNLRFIADLANRGRPLLISTGMSTEGEVATALEAGSSARGICLLHCVSAYPAPNSDANLRVIPALAARFGVPVGWSDHTVGPVTALGAVALGASLLEKHVTLDRTMQGPDHRASAEPGEFRSYVAAVRQMEAALGDGVKRITPAEEENRLHVRRSYHASRDLGAGTRLSADDVVLLRPASGLPPSTLLNGLVLARPVAAGAPVTREDVLRAP